jgi:hypothetical protein
VGVTIGDIPHYVQHGSFKLFKLHGSVHWGREVETTIANVNELDAWGLARALIDRADELKISNRYRIANALPLGKSVEEKPLFPALAIPVETKRDFECPADHLASLCEHLGKVSKILIIGWRATEGHFLKLLKEHLPADEIHVQAVAAGKEAAEEALAQIRGAGIKFVGSAQDGGFSEYVIRREAERFFGE